MDIKVDVESLKQGIWKAPVGALLVLLALWYAYQGWDQGQARKLDTIASEARTRVAAEVEKVVADARSQLESRRDRVGVVNAVRDADYAAARDVILQGWKTVEAVEFFGLDLAEAYKDPAAFGYGRLSLLEQALQVDTVHAAVIKDAGGPRLGLAAPVLKDGVPIGLVYARMSADALIAPVQDSVPELAYLALRQGRHNLAEAGNAELKNSAEADAAVIPDSPLRVVAAAPLAAGGLFGLGGYGEYGLAGALLIAGVVLLLSSRKKKVGERAAKAAEAAEPTLGELQQSGQLPSLPAHAPGTATPAGKLKTAEAAVAAAKPAVPEGPQVTLDRSIFRAYDIRGVVGQTLDPSVARLIGQAIGSVMAERSLRSIVVGRDGRLSSPQMSEALIEGLRLAGRDVIDIGEVATPLVYFATFQLRTGTGVAITGSHNPADYNGFKIMIEGETLSGTAISDLYARIAEGRLLRADGPGQYTRRDVIEDYVQRISGDIQIERKLRVVVDAGNGIPGAVAPRLLEAIGAEVEQLYCEVDGTFPNHHPDPSDPRNLSDLIRVVQRIDADLGIAFDGDGDRLGVVTKSGELIFPDRVLMLFAADVLERNPGACVIYDVKCTGHLATHILRHGGSPLMWKTGHSLIKAKMKETEAELAGEMSGHFFFRERWYGFDDGLYAACRLLEILAANPDEPEDVFAALPKGVSTPELKIEVQEGEQFAFIEKFLAQAKFEGARIATIDGLRADWADGWGLVRASNTTPTLVLRFDAKDGAALERVQAMFRAQLLAVDPTLRVPF